MGSPPRYRTYLNRITSILGVMDLTTVVVIFAFGIAAIQAECPSLESVPICDSEGIVPLCARKWYGPGDSDPSKACNGCSGHDSYDDYFDGDEFNAVTVY